MKAKATSDGKKGGLLKGKPHYDKDGNPVGGVKAVVVTDGGGKRPVELEGGEVIINKAASRKHWKTLSKINQSAGGGVPIPPPDGVDEDPNIEEYESGGKVIDFNRNKLPNRYVMDYAIKLKKDHPEIWKLGGNIYGNQAFENLLRVYKRGYWLDDEKWMYIKWQSFLARHKKNHRIAGVIAVLKWGGKVEKGWAYMKSLIEAEIKKKGGKAPKEGWRGRKKAPAKKAKGGNAQAWGFDKEKISSLKREKYDDRGSDKFASGGMTRTFTKKVPKPIFPVTVHDIILHFDLVLAGARYSITDLIEHPDKDITIKAGMNRSYRYNMSQSQILKAGLVAETIEKAITLLVPKKGDTKYPIYKFEALEDNVAVPKLTNIVSDSPEMIAAVLDKGEGVYGYLYSADNDEYVVYDASNKSIYYFDDLSEIEVFEMEDEPEPQPKKPEPTPEPEPEPKKYGQFKNEDLKIGMVVKYAGGLPIGSGKDKEDEIVDLYTDSRNKDWIRLKGGSSQWTERVFEIVSEPEPQKTYEELKKEALEKNPIVIEWSEGTMDEWIGASNLEELAEKISEFGFTDDPDNTYIKTKIWFDMYPSYVRVDASKLVGDYDFELEKKGEARVLLSNLKEKDPDFYWEQYLKEKRQPSKKTKKKKPEPKKEEEKKYQLLLLNKLKDQGIDTYTSEYRDIMAGIVGYAADAFDFYQMKSESKTAKLVDGIVYELGKGRFQ